MNEAQTLSVNFVTWNSVAYLPGCFESLDGQDWKDFTVTVIDNASNDGTVHWLQDNRPDVTALRNFRNQGMARAKNQAIALALSRWPEEAWASRYILFASPEVEFAPSCLGLLVDALEADPSLAACAPKILRAQFRAGVEDDRRETERSTKIESTGLAMAKSRNVYERGAGEEDRGQYDVAAEVFGFDGACVVYRASALNELKLAGEWFDEDFVEDWDDVDLAWRMRRLGMASRLVPHAVAWRHTSSVVHKRAGRRAPIVLDPLRTVRNRVWTIWKNDELGNRIVHLPWIVAAGAGHVARGIFRPSYLAAGASAYSAIGAMSKKHAELTKRAKVSGPEMRKWYV
ncbi:MAG: glycosyltransferase [Patescibacteria group bacterium]